MWKKLFAWLDERIGLKDLYKATLDRPEPKGNWWNTLGSASLFLFVLQGLTGIFLAFGTYGAKFDWDNPARINQSMGCVSSLVSSLFLAVCFGLFIVPAIVAALLGLPVIVGQLAGLLLGGAANVAAILVPLGMVERRVATLGEG